MGLMPGHLSSDHHSNATLKKTAMRLLPGQMKSDGTGISVPPA
jgi:hypothetical protein